MWRRFSGSTKRIIFSARAEADRRCHGLVTAEHLLLALLRNEEAEALEMLRHAKLSVEELERKLVAIIEEMPHSDTDRTTFSASANRILSLATHYSAVFGDGTVGTNHLLIGFFADRSTEIGSFLSASGFNIGLAHAFQISSVSRMATAEA